MGQEKKVSPHHTGCKNATVDVYSIDATVANRLLRGRALLDVDNKKFMFSQNEPRGPRSKEVYRGGMSRLVCRPDGLYTLTFSCMDGDMKHLKEVLISEVRDAAKAMSVHREAQKRERKGGEE